VALSRKAEVSRRFEDHIRLFSQRHEAQPPTAEARVPFVERVAVLLNGSQEAAHAFSLRLLT
jgi:hypothetical protein